MPQLVRRKKVIEPSRFEECLRKRVQVCEGTDQVEEALHDHIPQLPPRNRNVEEIVVVRQVKDGKKCERSRTDEPRRSQQAVPVAVQIKNLPIIDERERKRQRAQRAKRKQIKLPPEDRAKRVVYHRYHGATDQKRDPCQIQPLKPQHHLLAQTGKQMVHGAHGHAIRRRDHEEKQRPTGELVHSVDKQVLRHIVRQDLFHVTVEGRHLFMRKVFLFAGVFHHYRGRLLDAEAHIERPLVRGLAGAFRSVVKKALGVPELFPGLVQLVPRGYFPKRAVEVFKVFLEPVRRIRKGVVDAHLCQPLDAVNVRR